MAWLECAAAVSLAVSALWWLVRKRYPWLVEDLVYIKTLGGCYYKVKQMKDRKMTMYGSLQRQARATPHRHLVLYRNETWTYRQMLWWSSKCCRALCALGMQPGDTIGILMMNEPAYVAMWAGCTALGVVPALLNTNLRMKTLLHCIDVAEVKILVVGSDPELCEAVMKIDDELRDRNVKVYVYGEATDALASFSELVESQENADIPDEWRGDRSFEDSMCYIYTSGTTGFPKAVMVSPRKCFQAASIMTVLKSDTTCQVVYTAMPLYHTAAGLFGLNGVLLCGWTIVLRKGFSASQFWPDCRRYDVTIAQYIGEIIRYVCSQPPRPDDRKHKLRCIAGNGLRPDVWRTFLDRFGPHIRVMEMYAATEGNIGFLNIHNKFGCLGTYSPILKKFGNGVIVKYDPEKEEIVRDKDGHAVRVDANESGLLLGLMNRTFAISAYKGKKQLTESKILRDVFKAGDKYFNTGDLLMYDDNYRLYFRDRVGDTYRWKGENVSTNEVSDIVVQGPGISEANVYGVEIKGTEGKAGMATVVLQEGEKLSCKSFYDHVTDNLPSYARPVFVRVKDSLELTGTLKQRKVNLKREGFDLNVVKDSVYFLDGKNKTYVPFTAEIQKGLEHGSIRI